MPLLAQRHSMLRHAIGLAPLIALAVPVDRAEAACDPASPVNDTVVTCTGPTSNGATGFGNSSDTGNTYNIVSDASVTGTSNGLVFDRGTVNNFGSIIGSSGISADTVNVTSNHRHHLGRDLPASIATTLVNVANSPAPSRAAFSALSAALAPVST